jgi:hypothetical protein
MKTWTLSVAAIATSLSLAHTARADQCAWNEEAHATKAASILAKHPKVLEYCEPCGDKAPGEPFVADTVAVTTPERGYKELSINGKEIDLAYVYVQVSSTQYKNLAKLAGCPASGVSPSLKIADETPTGVLITSNNPPEPPPPPPPIVVAAPPPPPPAPPPQITYHTTTIEQPVPWIVLALAGAGGFISGAASMLVAMTIRSRRRAMRPRASDLQTS